MYRRNYLYINAKSQSKVANYKLFIGGCGLGSVIAECALRLGFQNICIVDGDKVELSNLNRQNYTFIDNGRPKVEALKERLLQINPRAKIKAINQFLTCENIWEYIGAEYDIAINTIDFTTNIPFLFDKICCDKGIPVLHPLNLGWGASVIVINPQSSQIIELGKDHKNFELNMARHIINKLDQENRTPEYLPEIVRQYDLIKQQADSPPQLSVGSWLVASMCTTLMYNICLKKPIKMFPEIYFETF